MLRVWGRFIQIDVRYDVDQEDVLSQNCYTYTLNNPYKTVDRDGEKAIKGQNNKTIFTMHDNEFNKYIKGKSPLLKITLKASRSAYKKLKRCLIKEMIYLLE